jgi:hypothetical protein
MMSTNRCGRDVRRAHVVWCVGGGVVVWWCVCVRERARARAGKRARTGEGQSWSLSST